MTLFVLVFYLSVSPTDAWPAFRGTGDSLSDARQLPLTWSDTENVAWRADLSGFGQSSPVIWKDRVFCTSVLGEMKDTLIVECCDLATGKALWKKEKRGSQPTKDSGYVSKAAPTPVVDAERVYAFFESGDLVAYDHAGEEVWARSLVQEFGEIRGAHGLGSSLARCPGGVVVLVDHDGPSYVMACEGATGKTRWKTDRASGSSWTTPLYLDKEKLLVASGHDGAQAYDIENGAEVWTFSGLKGNTVCSPTPAEGAVVIGSDKVENNISINLGGRGDVTSTHRRWVAERASTSFGSPLVDGSQTYIVNKAGVCFCFDTQTGELRWTERLPSSCWASPVAAEGRIYFFSKDGKTRVLAQGDAYKVLADNNLTVTDKDDRVYGVAVVDGKIVIRLYRQLVCLANQ